MKTMKTLDKVIRLTPTAPTFAIALVSAAVLLLAGCASPDPLTPPPGALDARAAGAVDGAATPWPAAR